MRNTLIDLAIGLALLVAFTGLGQWYVQRLAAAAVTAEFYQSEFGPAVALACGRGYVNPNEQELPALRAFLLRQAGSFSCADLPAQIPAGALTGPQATWKYLLWSAALTWKLSGEISWAALQSLAGPFLGLTAAAAYAALRLAGGQALAAAGAVFVATSPLHLRHVLHLRDYSKAPFMIAIGLILAVLATRRLSARMLAAWALAFGVVLGIGTGFRNDLLIVTPAFLLTAGFAALRDGEQRVRRALTALGAGALGFAVAAAPVLGAYSQGGGASMSHVALLGLSETFDGPLHVQASPLYRIGYAYNDTLVATVVSDAAYRINGHRAPIAPYDSAYDRGSNTLVRFVAQTFPGDLWVRGLASLLNVVQLPGSSVEDTEPPPVLPSNWISKLFEWRAAAVRGSGPVLLGLLLLALGVAAVRSPAPAALLLVCTAYFAAYPAVQFHERHYFHLNIIPVAAVVYLLNAMWQYAHGSRRQPAREQLAPAARNVAAVMVFGVVILAGPLWALRAFQNGRTLALFEQTLAAPRDQVALLEAPPGGDEVGLVAAALPARQRSDAAPHTVQTEYLAIELAAGACDAAAFSMRLDYDASPGMGDFSRTLQFQPPLDAGTTTVAFVPVYYYRGGSNGDVSAPVHFAFKQLSVSARERSCITGFSRVRDTSALPMLLDLTLPPGWQGATRYQTLVGWESPRRAEGVRIYFPEAVGNVSRREPFGALSALAPSMLAETADIVSMPSPGRVVVAGRGGIGGAGRATYLAVFRQAPVVPGRRLVAQGVLTRGGLTVGLLAGGRWVTQVAVTTPGEFVLLIEVPAGVTEASVVVANSIPGWTLRNEFELSRFGWIP